MIAQYPGVMPVVDGDIDVLEFIPDGDIIGGYGDLYLLAMRAGMTIESSREVQFIQDNTVFKGKQRADGQPVIPGAFVAININNQEVTTVMEFAADNANDAKLSAFVVGSETLSPVFALILTVIPWPQPVLVPKSKQPATSRGHRLLLLTTAKMCATGVL